MKHAVVLSVVVVALLVGAYASSSSAQVAPGPSAGAQGVVKVGDKKIGAAIGPISLSESIEDKLLRAWGSASAVGGPGLVSSPDASSSTQSLLTLPPNAVITVHNSGPTSVLFTYNLTGDTFTIGPGITRSFDAPTTGSLQYEWNGSTNGARFIWVVRQHQ